MNDNKSEQNASSDKAEGTNPCEPGCSCGATGSGSKWKMIICLVVLIAAAAVLTRGFARNVERKVAQAKGSFATTAPVTASITEKVEAATTNQTKPSLWSKPLKGMASLNEVAAKKNAVFVYLVEKGREPSQIIKRNIERAADKSKFRGMAIAFYTLDDRSKDYAQITSQSPAPCVLALVKGGGMVAVAGDISVEKLLQAIVSASRPSSCGPSGCGTSSPDCK